jgi:hypothetical protein
MSTAATPTQPPSTDPLDTACENYDAALDRLRKARTGLEIARRSDECEHWQREVRRLTRERRRVAA